MLEDISKADIQKNVNIWETILSNGKTDLMLAQNRNKKVSYEAASPIKTSLDVADTPGSLCDHHSM